MQFFLAVIVFLLIVLAALVLVVLHFLRKGVLKFRKMMTGDLDDEETFKRMADKHYRTKDDPQFDKDYFRSAGSSQGKRQGEQASTQRRTTTTSEGVTIIDDRSDENRRKIFEKDEGEYVDYQEV